MFKFQDPAVSISMEKLEQLTRKQREDLYWRIISNLEDPQFKMDGKWYFACRMPYRWQEIGTPNRVSPDKLSAPTHFRDGTQGREHLFVFPEGMK